MLFRSLPTQPSRASQLLLFERHDSNPLVVKGATLAQVSGAGAQESVGTTTVAPMSTLGDKGDVSSLFGIVVRRTVIEEMLDWRLHNSPSPIPLAASG